VGRHDLNAAGYGFVSLTLGGIAGRDGFHDVGIVCKYITAFTTLGIMASADSTAVLKNGQYLLIKTYGVQLICRNPFMLAGNCHKKTGNNDHCKR
jgi:hypothetical protein